MKQTDDLVTMKAKRPVSRKFWNLLKYLPSRIRAEVVRSQFEVSYDLPPGVVLKQADTQEEISQALHIVYEAYLELGYIDPHPDQMRFNKFLALPTTVFLVAKLNEEVIGTMAIVADSALGLPVDQSWNLSRLRDEGHLLAEISSLCIKKSFKMRRGLLLLPLCKLMFEYCTKILKIDTIVISTTHEVEYFYTDVLLFETEKVKSGAPNTVAKGNPSCFCYMTFNQQLYDRYKKVYSSKSLRRNLHKFFLDFNDPNFILKPDPKLSVHGYLHKKNQALAKILNEHSALAQDLSPNDRKVIHNLKVHTDDNFSPGDTEILRELKRVVVREKAWIFIEKEKLPLEVKLIDISHEGFQVQLSHSKDHAGVLPKQGSFVVLILQLESGPIAAKAKIQWVRGHRWFGCKLENQLNIDWEDYLRSVWRELEEIDSNVTKLEDYKKDSERKAS